MEYFHYISNTIAGPIQFVRIARSIFTRAISGNLDLKYRGSPSVMPSYLPGDRASCLPTIIVLRESKVLRVTSVLRVLRQTEGASVACGEPCRLCHSLNSQLPCNIDTRIISQPRTYCKERGFIMTRFSQNFYNKIFLTKKILQAATHNSTELYDKRGKVQLGSYLSTLLRSQC